MIVSYLGPDGVFVAWPPGALLLSAISNQAPDYRLPTATAYILCMQLWVGAVLAYIKPNTHRRRRRDATKQFPLVGVGGV